MLCCCKECNYKNHNDKYCSFLKAQLKYIKCCPMMIQDELLNNAEKYMKENESKIFMQYILKETGISFKVGDLLSVLDDTFFWHSYGGRHPKYVKINKVLEDGSFECFDPFYDYKFEAFSEHYVAMDYQTNLTPDDFDDAENDFWCIDSTKNDSVLGIHLFPISKKQEMMQYIHQRKQCKCP